MAWRGRAWQARMGLVWQGLARQGTAGMAWQRWFRQGSAGRGAAGMRKFARVDHIDVRVVDAHGRSRDRTTRKRPAATGRSNEMGFSWRV